MTFKNTTGAPVTGVKLSLSVPKGWNSVVASASGSSKTIAEPVAPGASVSATFKVASGRSPSMATWRQRFLDRRRRRDAIRDDG